MKKRKIAVICSSRATYGYKRKIIQLIHNDNELELQAIVVGMHLLPQYGMSVREIEKDNIPIAASVDMMIGGDSAAAWVKSLGVETQSLAQVFSMLQPDIVLVTGDRAEMFFACASAVYMNIPVAHIQSGDRSGHIDGSVRHAMTKLAHIHFPSCQDSADRVLKMGEEAWRIHNVGAPQLDEMIFGEKTSKEQLQEEFGINFNEPVLLVIQHAVLLEVDNAHDQMVETLEAIKKLRLQTIMVYPNIDAGGQKIISAMKKYEHLSYIKSYSNIERASFISLLSNASAIVGNSSCGILEAPSFKLPAINIGNRQRDRMQAVNVINTDHDRDQIVSEVNKALFDKEYREKLEACKNPYGDGNSSKKIVDILKTLKIDKKLADKIITY